MRFCSMCGCTDFDACITATDGMPIACSWVEEDLCSACVEETVEADPV